MLHTSAEELAKPDDAGDDGGGSRVAGGNGRVWRVAPSTARRLSCDCPTSTMVDGPDGAALHLGRRTRRIGGRLRRAVHARDAGMCRTPGCTDRAAQIHHLRHWAMGGPTCLPNVVSLCDRHHWLVHEGGYAIAIREGDGWVLMSPDGLRVGPHPEPREPARPLPVAPEIDADAVTGRWDGSRLDPDPILINVLGGDYQSRAEDVSEETSGGCRRLDDEDEEVDYSLIRLNAFTT